MLTDGVSVLVANTHTHNWEGKERNGTRVEQGGAVCVCVDLLMSIYGHNRHHFSISCCLQVLHFIFAKYIFTKTVNI